MEEMPLPELAAWGRNGFGEKNKIGCIEFLCNSHMEMTSGNQIC